MTKNQAQSYIYAYALYHYQFGKWFSNSGRMQRAVARDDVDKYVPLRSTQATSSWLAGCMAPPKPLGVGARAIISTALIDLMENDAVRARSRRVIEFVP